MGKRLFFHIGDTSAQAFYRAALPGFWLQRDGLDITISPNIDMNHDVFYFQRFIEPYVFAQIKKRRKFLVMGADDLLNKIEPSNPAYSFYHDRLSYVKQLFEEADAVVVSTQYLADEIGNWINHDNVVVLPNLIDLTMYEGETEKRNNVRIAWTGSIHHARDLDIIFEPLARIAAEYGNKLDICFFCWIPSELRGKYRVEPCVAVHDYPRRLKWLSPDITLSPLQDCPFNHAKSSNRLVENAAVGSAVICSPLTPYQDAVALASTSQEWYELMKLLIEDEEVRAKIIIEQMPYVLRNSWQKSPSHKDWFDFFNRIEVKNLEQVRNEWLGTT